MLTYGSPFSMNTRVELFLVALAILALARLAQALSQRGEHPFFDSARVMFAVSSTRRLVLASFLTLFAELAFIRWIAVEVRIFAYFKNLALLLCFVGFGLGCALVRKPPRWESAIKAFLGLVLVVRLPWWSGRVTEKLSAILGAAPGIEIWHTLDAANWTQFLSAALLAVVLFFLLILIFVPLGQIVSRELNLAPRTLSAYSWNLFGSLAGILAFILVSRLMLPPWIWLSAVVLGFACHQERQRERKLLLILLAPLALMLYEPHTPDHFNLWTPYHQIDYKRIYRNGEFAAGDLQVNHVGYQLIVNLSDGFLARHPGLMNEKPENNPYNLPFRFARTSPSVLIVGSGTGNDAAAAVRNRSSVIDAVEIDPAILQLGRSEHPEHPYDSVGVTTHVTDARAFFKRRTQRYDLVLFGLLDSHTQLSDYSNMRIDNFVYTEESFREAKNLLTDDGVLFVKFQVDKPWIAQRLIKMLQELFGKAPLVFSAPSSYSASASCFVISPSDRTQRVLSNDRSLAQFVRDNAVQMTKDDVPITTDDWPYLYQRDKRIPQLFVLVSILVMSLATILYLQIPGARDSMPSPFFFFMGTGFMLLETQVLSRLALYFGTTWQVNGIVISCLLVSLLAANVITAKCKEAISERLVLGGLFFGLGIAYFVPFSRMPFHPAIVGLSAAGVFAVPVFFAGLLFSKEFASVASPSAALGANVLGAVLGGLLENLSLMIGMRALLLLAILIYSFAGLALLTSRHTLSGDVIPKPAHN